MHYIFLLFYKLYVGMISALPLSAQRTERQKLKALSFYLMVYEWFTKPIFLAQKVRVKSHDKPAQLPNYFVEGNYEYTVLFVMNSDEDEVSKHSNALAKLLEEHNVRVLYAAVDVNASKIHLYRHHFGYPDDASLKFPYEFAAFITTLRYLHVDRIHIHQIHKMPYYFVKALDDIATVLNIPYDISLQDYAYICPRTSLRDAEGNSLQEVDLEAYEGIIKRDGGYIPRHISVGVWRDMTHKLLQHAHAVYAPNNDILAAYKQVFPDVEIHLRSFAEEQAQAQYPDPLKDYYKIAI